MDSSPSSPSSSSGSPPAAELLTQVYEELRQLAARRLATEPPGQTLQATALVHEAWLRLGHAPDRRWNDRTHFYAAAAQAMRRILVDQARRKNAIRHGGQYQRLEISALDELPAQTLAEPPDDRIEALDAAIERLAARAPDRAELVRLRFYTGLSLAEAAEVLGLSLATAKRHWSFARAWLFRELTRGARTR